MSKHSALHSVHVHPQCSRPRFTPVQTAATLHCYIPSDMSQEITDLQQACQCSPSKTVYTCLASSTRATCPAHHNLLHLHPNKTWWQTMNNLAQYLLASYNLSLHPSLPPSQVQMLSSESALLRSLSLPTCRNFGEFSLQKCYPRE